jgi:hypothetical protein
MDGVDQAMTFSVWNKTLLKDDQLLRVCRYVIDAAHKKSRSPAQRNCPNWQRDEEFKVRIGDSGRRTKGDTGR